MKHIDDTASERLNIPAERRLPPARREALKKDLLSRIVLTGGEEEARSRTRSRMRVAMIPALAALLVGLSAGSLTTAYALADVGRPSADAASLSSISTEGHPVVLTPASQRVLHRTHGFPPGDTSLPRAKGRALLMASRGPTVFFRVASDRGEDCFYIGRIAERDDVYELGGGRCWRPDSRRPMLDLSPIQASGPGGFQVLQIQGFAADGVKTVAVTDASGANVAEAAVKDNVYRLTAYPPAGVVELRALDEGSNVVQHVRYAP